MIDSIEGCLFMENDIRKIRYGTVRDAGQLRYGISIFLQGCDKPVSATYETKPQMLSVLSDIQKAWADSAQEQQIPAVLAEFRILKERMDETERQLEEWRTQRNSAAGGKGSKKKASKKKGPEASREPARFVPPTDEEIIAYIKEKKIDEKLGTPAEVIAEAFRSVYESNEPTGEKDENGFSIYKWKKSSGEPVENWKLCMNTFKGRQLMWNGERSSGSGRRPNENQFTRGVENNRYDFDALEEEIANSPIAT